MVSGLLPLPQDPEQMQEQVDDVQVEVDSGVDVLLGGNLQQPQHT